MIKRLEIFGKQVQILRKESGKKQREMAELLGMTLRNYQRIEHGEINPSALTLCALADYFGVSIDYLLGRSQER